MKRLGFGVSQYFHMQLRLTFFMLLLTVVTLPLLLQYKMYQVETDLFGGLHLGALG
jgi:hypothetical protein